MGSGNRDLNSIMSELTYDQVFDDMPTLHNSSNFDQNIFFDPSTFSTDPSPFLNTPNINVSSSSSFSSSSSTAAPAAEAEFSDDSEMSSDILFTYINRILMEEDIDTKFDQYPDNPALLAAEKPFLEILEKSPTSPNQPPLDSNHSSDSPNESIRNYDMNSNDSPNGVMVENSWPYDPIEYYQLQNPPFVDRSSQFSFSSANSDGNIFEGLGDLVQNQPAWHFARGYEEAQKFLPSDDKLVINLEASGFSLPSEVKEENEEANQVHGGRWGRKNRYSEDLSLEEGRSNKQTALYSEEIETEAVREMFDKVLLYDVETYTKKKKELREAMQSDAMRHSQSKHSKGSANGKGRGKKQPKQEVVDLRTLLIHCAQAVASDDYRSANELLKQIRQHSSPTGDATQRLAHCFADGLQARLAGTGSEIYRSLVAKRIPTVTILKAYLVVLAASPFKKLSHFFSNQTIFDTVEGAKRVHIIDYGIAYGFQWPCLLKRLSDRLVGLRLFESPASIYLAWFPDYARSFSIPFEYRAIAAKWETIQVEDLKIDKDEVVIVNSLYQFRQLMDETVVADSQETLSLIQ
ncbi:Scarecrow-like protein 9 [Ananas comosus]|uniref:Scarecrow-like protein 9 n=1 Tax=Ananas comosus TaxID=4615 RepID=A0A199VAV7_ANACO|nr:Scarecrow-like protein 9 [Ananas comosus]